MPERLSLRLCLSAFFVALSLSHFKAGLNFVQTHTLFLSRSFRVVFAVQISEFRHERQ